MVLVLVSQLKLLTTVGTRQSWGCELEWLLRRLVFQRSAWLSNQQNYDVVKKSLVD